MANLSRRGFLNMAAMSTTAAGLSTLQLDANPLGLPIGCQTYPVRHMIAEDFPGTLKKLSQAGFQTIELCSPVGYHDFAGVGKYSAAELRRILSDANLTCISSHFSIQELRKDLHGRIAWAKEIGLTQMMVPSLDGPQHPTMDDVKRAADEYNKMAAVSHAAGIQQGLHNERFELSTVDGKRTYDMLFELLDPKLVKFQFQVSTVAEGFHAAHYFTKYPGRFISMHAQGWSAKTKKIVPIGKGTLNWKKIFTAAKTGGIQNYFVEMNLEYMRESVPYLKSLHV
ncbi:MAG: sugar phosphate isomerase/epimerase family protein [Bryobacteraceae bacterium]